MSYPGWKLEKIGLQRRRRGRGRGRRRREEGGGGGEKEKWVRREGERDKKEGVEIKYGGEGNGGGEHKDILELRPSPSFCALLVGIFRAFFAHYTYTFAHLISNSTTILPARCTFFWRNRQGSTN